MTNRRLWAQIADMTEEELRLQIVIPLLRATKGVSGVTDVHGTNERGLDVIFFTETHIEPICYGLQLKAETIGGGARGGRTVKSVIDQLQLADDYSHPIAIKNGEYRIDRFVVATSGGISATAREEIARRVKKPPVLFWDGDEIIRRIHQDLPQLFKVSDGVSVAYLNAITDRYDALDALDQVPGVAKRTLSEVFVDCNIRRNYDPGVSAGQTQATTVRRDIPALSITAQGHNAILVADQDAGKTSVFRMVALTRARQLLSDAGDTSEGETAIGLPILVKARDILGSGLSVEDGIEAEFRRMKATDLVGTLKPDLENGNYFVLIDGFSEFTKDEDKDLLARLIDDFAEKYPRVRVIVAARPVDFLTPKYLTRFFQYSLADFDDNKVAQLLRKWTSGTRSYEDVAQKLATRLREALQLPGSPIPATIGVMLHEEQGHYVTNTAEAIDRYMVIRLGRYAHELGMRQQIEWTRKQDLLAEVSYGMINEDAHGLSRAEFVSRFDAIARRKGDEERGELVMEELVGSGVLVPDGAMFTFHRTSFRDFFAGHHIFRTQQTEAFAVDQLLARKWGGALVFAAGLRRENSELLSNVVSAVCRIRDGAIGDLSDDYYYSAYLCGRMLSNSDGAEHGPRVAALRIVVEAAAKSIPGFEALVLEKYGAIGRLLALIGAEHSFFATVGVPWLRIQLKEMLADSTLTEEERYMLASTYAQLGFDDACVVLREAVREAKSLRVLVALDLLIHMLDGRGTLSDSEQAALKDTKQALRRKKSGRAEEIEKLLQIKPKVLEVERGRLRRLMAARKRGEEVDG